MEKLSENDNEIKTEEINFSNLFNEYNEYYDKMKKIKENILNVLTDFSKNLNESFDKFVNENFNILKEELNYQTKYFENKENEIKNIIYKYNLTKFNEIYIIFDNLFNSIKNLYEIFQNSLKEKIVINNSPITEFIRKNQNFINETLFLNKICKNIDVFNLNQNIQNDELNNYLNINNSLKKLLINNKNFEINEKVLYLNKQNIKELIIHNLNLFQINKLFPFKSKYKNKNISNMSSSNDLILINDNLSNDIEVEDSKDVKEEKDEIKNSVENNNEKKEKEENEEINDQNYYYMTKLKLKNVQINEINIDAFFPYLMDLKISEKLIKIDFKNSTLNIKKLSFEKINLQNFECNEIMKNILKNDNLLKNLESISFKNNKLTYINFYNEECTKNFEILTELNFENNKIFKFAIENLSLFPNLKLLNLINNNFAFPDNFKLLKESLKNNNVLILISKNLFMLKLEQRNEYIEYLNEILPYFNYPLNYLNLSFMFNNINYDKINSFLFGINFIELNLSHCYLSNEKIVKILNENNLFNLTKLIINNNLLNDKIFNDFVDNKFNLILCDLKLLDISGNEEINLNDFESFKKFIISFRSIKKLKLFHTNFEKSFSDFIKKKYKILINEKKKYNENDLNKNNCYEEIFKFLQSNSTMKIYLHEIYLKKKYLQKININYYKDNLKII